LRARNARFGCLELHQPDASMGPRSLERGMTTGSTSRSSPPRSFNGAALT